MCLFTCIVTIKSPFFIYVSHVFLPYHEYRFASIYAPQRALGLPISEQIELFAIDVASRLIVCKLIGSTFDGSATGVLSENL